jgi:23S rRNA (adenine2503-C2)-methyltransferase
MGSGEPLDNYDNVVRFYELLTNDDGINISARNLTISTCGIVPRMYELAKLKAGFTLAVSLHAPNDEIRKSMMPIANAYKIEDVIEACRNYVKETGRRVSFEYSLVRGVNDSEANARELISRIKGINCHVNLIPVNPIKERDYQQSVAKSIEKFKNILEKNGIKVTIRREMGRDINGACGQLRKDYVHSGDA